ncbi:snurportin-1 [Drosophila eugracilis]|uniref:snurportin-1 n=1 Tax=Drosophila eugracilis TaxID=29029 RepID=UPI0007E7C34E|nr:snurportin-1 [Drosophila eugracilis]
MNSSFQNLYKKSLDMGEQQKQRQKDLLKQQKLRRQQEQDDSRPLQNPGKRPPKKKNWKRTGHQKGIHYRPQLSEWLRHKPEDLSEWLLVPCPVGKRCLVVASNGITKAYSKNGWMFMSLQSSLPGDRQHQKSQTILDCVYVEDEDTFYVLDAISFGQQDLQECEASFRFYWLRARFEENDFAKVGDHNEKSFVLLDHVDFENTSAVEKVLHQYPLFPENKPALDGFLFYHKEASYVCQTTPLVCWLFPFMMMDVLGLPVSNSYTAPEDYQHGQALKYMNEFDRKLAEHRKQLKEQKKADKMHEKRQTAMEAEEGTNSDEYASLKEILDYQRRLELGELDMDCAEPPSADAC